MQQLTIILRTDVLINKNISKGPRCQLSVFRPTVHKTNIFNKNKTPHIWQAKTRGYLTTIFLFLCNYRLFSIMIHQWSLRLQHVKQSDTSQAQSVFNVFTQSDQQPQKPNYPLFTFISKQGCKGLFSFLKYFWVFDFLTKSQFIYKECPTTICHRAKNRNNSKGLHNIKERKAANSYIIWILAIV